MIRGYYHFNTFFKRKNTHCSWLSLAPLSICCSHSHCQPCQDSLTALLTTAHPGSRHSKHSATFCWARWKKPRSVTTPNISTSALLPLITTDDPVPRLDPLSVSQWSVGHELINTGQEVWAASQDVQRPGMILFPTAKGVHTICADLCLLCSGLVPKSTLVK